MTLLELRKAKGLSQVEVAEAIGKAQATVSAYESGERRFDSDVALKLAELYGVDRGDIYDAFDETRDSRKGKE